MPEISQEELDALKANSEAKAQLEASNKRLLEESATNKKRAQEAEGKLTEAEKAKLEADGNTQALLDQERSERLKIEEKFHSRTKTALKEKLRTEVLKHAKDAHDVDMVLRVTDHKALLKLDEETLSVTGTEDFVKKVRETHSFLFSKKKIDAGGNLPPKAGDKDFIPQEADYLKELKSCSTRKEMDEVRKKYGKAIA